MPLIPPGCEPFLAAVTAAPFDDTPRLAMADWLQPHSPEWAEYIRDSIWGYDPARPLSHQLDVAVVGEPIYRIQHRLAEEIGAPLPLRLFFARGFPACCAIGGPDPVPDVTHLFPWPITMVFVGDDNSVEVEMLPAGRFGFRFRISIGELLQPNSFERPPASWNIIRMLCDDLSNPARGVRQIGLNAESRPLAYRHVER